MRPHRIGQHFIGAKNYHIKGRTQRRKERVGQGRVSGCKALEAHQSPGRQRKGRERKDERGEAEGRREEKEKKREPSLGSSRRLR